MHQYLVDMKLLFAKIAEHGMPVAVNFEPDSFGYLLQRASMGKPPEMLPAKVHHADVPECASLPETAAGLARCLVKIARANAPMARVGYHASMWGSWYDVLDPNADVEAS